MINKRVLLLESVSEQADQLLKSSVQVSTARSPDGGGAIAQHTAIHGILTRGKGDVSRQLIEQCPDLEVIARCGVGLDNVDVDFATRQGIKVINAPGSNADTVAEHTLGLMLMLQRQLYQTVKAVKNNQWNFRTAYHGDEIRGKTLGILGMGNIGKKVAKLASAFGVKVIYWSASQQSLPYVARCLSEVLQQADLISLHLPLTDQTRHLINREALEKMRPHALLINTARGGIIDQKALTDALSQGTIGGFAADVLEEQPPAPDDPLLRMPNVLITPHSASLTKRTYNEMCLITVKNIISLLSGDSIEEHYIFNRDKL